MAVDEKLMSQDLSCNDSVKRTLESKSNTNVKRTLVLDLDSTLIYSSGDMDAYAKLNLYSDPRRLKHRLRVYKIEMIDVFGLPGVGEKTQMWGIFRPFVFEFLRIISQYYNIVIWTAGQYKYGHAIVEKLFSTNDIRPVKILTNEDCSSREANLHKPLSKIYSLLPEANETNTLALDDRDETFQKNPYNGIQIPAYEPRFTAKGIMAVDQNLQKLLCWLSLPHVVGATDVRYLDKSKIFTTSLDEYRKQLEDTMSPPVPPMKEATPEPVKSDEKQSLITPTNSAPSISKRTEDTQRPSFFSSFFPSVRVVPKIT